MYKEPDSALQVQCDVLYKEPVPNAFHTSCLVRPFFLPHAANTASVLIIITLDSGLFSIRPNFDAFSALFLLYYPKIFFPIDPFSSFVSIPKYFLFFIPKYIFYSICVFVVKLLVTICKRAQSSPHPPLEQNKFGPGVSKSNLNNC